MNRPVHQIAGGAAGLGSYLIIKKRLNEKPTPVEAVLCSLLGVFAGTLPDLLEPANSPFHRSTFHSAGIMVALGYGAYRLLKGEDIETVLKIFGLASASGYGSHILLDSMTPAQIPFL